MFRAAGILQPFLFNPARDEIRHTQYEKNLAFFGIFDFNMLLAMDLLRQCGSTASLNSSMFIGFNIFSSAPEGHGESVKASKYED